MNYTEAEANFLSKFVEYVKGCCPDSCIMLTENLEWKMRAFMPVESLSVDWLYGMLGAWRRVSFCTGDSREIARSFIAYAREMQDNEIGRFSGLVLPEPDSEITDPAKWLGLINEYRAVVAIKRTQVFYKPFLLVDLDLKDQDKIAKETGALPTATDETFYLTATPGAKKAVLNSIIDLNLLVTETDPSLIMFTGGGLHIWYALSDRTDGDRYTLLHKRVCERLNGLFPKLVFDTAANQVTQNLRIPFSYNGKYTPEIQCEILYSANKFETADWVKVIHDEIPLTEEYRTGNLLTVGSTIDYSVEGVLNVHGKFTPRKLGHEGLRNFRRDPRMWDFIQRYLTFEGICSYTKTPIRNLSRHSGTTGDPADYYLLCSSPLRKDEHPSFMVYNSGLYCEDRGKKNTIYDFGVLMRLLLINLKRRLGFVSTDTTRYEADFHCVFAAYLNYIQVTRTNILPMIEVGSGSKKRDGVDTEFDPKLLKKLFPGKQYYCNLQVTLENWVKQFRKEGSWSEDFLTALLRSTPDIYYFYDGKQSNSGAAYLAATSALCVIHYFNAMNLGIHFSKPGKFTLYVVNPELELHEEFDTWIINHTLAGADDDLVSKTRIQTLIVNTNMSDSGSLPKGTSRLCDHVVGVLAGLASLSRELDKYLPSSVIPNDAQIRAALVSFLTEVIVPGAKISPCDLKFSVLDDRRFIEFDNCLVQYQGKDGDYTAIGSVLPIEEKNALLHTSVVNLRIPHGYRPGKETPMFDKFIADMTYDENCFDKALWYFLSSLLYSPRMHPGKVWYLLGRDGDNGKSVIGTVVTGLLGPAYTTTKDLSDLTAATDRGKNTRNELVHSLLNVTQDSSRNKLEGIFKSLVEGEPVTVRALYQKECDVSLPTHYMVNANSLPATWGETQPLVKRIVLTRVDRVVPKAKRIDNLGNKIVNAEADGIWPRIIEHVPLFLKEGLKGFIQTDELAFLNKEFYEQNDVFTFVRDYCFYDPDADWHLTGKQFKVLYNKYRTYLSKQAVASDNLISEAESFVRTLFLGVIDEAILEKGFSYRSSKVRGLPLRVFIPPKQIGNYQAIDSAPDGTEPPSDSYGRFDN